jgi:hypothetical protein
MPFPALSGIGRQKRCTKLLHNSFWSVCMAWGGGARIASKLA